MSGSHKLWVECPACFGNHVGIIHSFRGFPRSQDVEMCLAPSSCCSVASVLLSYYDVDLITCFPHEETGAQRG